MTRDLHIISTGAEGPDHVDFPGELDPPASSRLHFWELCLYSVSRLLNPLGACLIVPGTVDCLLGLTSIVMLLEIAGCLVTVDCFIILLGNAGGLRGVWRALLAHHPEKLSISQEVSA